MLPIDLSRCRPRPFLKGGVVLLALASIGSSVLAQNDRSGQSLMGRAPVNGGEIEYEIRGERGDPVLFIHGAFVADTFLPLMDQASLTGYQLINYHRRGYGQSTSAEFSPDVYVLRAGADAAELLTYLGVENAHVVAHSSGAVVAMQFACEYPEFVKSMVLIEPPLMSVPSAAEHGQRVAGAASRYAEGDVAGAVDEFMQIISDPSWREVLEGQIPAGAEQAVRHAATFFEFELPGIGAWQCDIEKRRSFPEPVLFLQGDRTPDFHAEAGPVVREWFPQTEGGVIEDASHMVMVDNPEATARQIAMFLDQVD